MTSASQPRDAQTLTLPDGRILGYAAYGSPLSPTTPVIFYFHGLPGGRVEGKPWFESSLSPALSATMIAIDRPGMGLSTFQPSRRMLDFPRDVLALADHLHREQFYVMGTSGGAPYALACAKDIPRTRLLGCTVVSGLYPGTREGMMFKLRTMLFLGYWVPTSLVAAAFDKTFGKAARDPNPQVLIDMLMVEMKGRPAPDQMCLENLEVRDSVVDSMRVSFAQGGMGPAWDLRLNSDWGFELSEVDGNDVIIWHGRDDINTPAGLAEEASKAMPGCRLKIFEKETHMSVPFNHLDEILRGALKV